MVTTSGDCGRETTCTVVSGRVDSRLKDTSVMESWRENGVAKEVIISEVHAFLTHFHWIGISDGEDFAGGITVAKQPKLKGVNVR